MSGVRIIRRHRGKGKTTTLIRWMLEDPHNRAIVVADHGQAEFAKRLLVKESGSNEHAGQIFSMAQSRYRLRGSAVRELAIDEALNVPKRLHGIPVAVVTMTIDEDGSPWTYELLATSR